MLRFFINIKFWLPILLVIALGIIAEVLLRFGNGDDYIKPQSLLGEAVYRHKAIKEFGVENIHWITIGDSRTDWGIQHSKLFEFQRYNNINHLRLSFGGSNFMAIQATIDWSIANMPNLEGIMIGVSSENFAHKSNATTQFNVAWPFRKYFDYDKYSYFKDKHSLWSKVSRNALSVYYKDIQSFLIEARKRNKQIASYKNNKYKNIFKFNRNMPKNVCQFPLNNLQQCVETATKLFNSKSILDGTEQFIVNVCNNNNAKHWLTHDKTEWKFDTQTKIDIIENWQRLFMSVLKQNIKLKVVQLPEHSMFEYLFNPSDIDDLMSQVINKFADHSGYEFLDLTNILKQDSNDPQCQFFSDPIHYNNFGKQLITNKIIETFPKNEKINSNSQGDLIKKSQFEIIEQI